MSDYRCEHGEMAMGRYCEECRKQRLAEQNTSKVADDVIAERRRQVLKDGCKPPHDSEQSP